MSERVQLIDVPKVAEMLACSESHIWRLIAKGKLPAVKLSPRVTRVRLDVVEKLIADAALTPAKLVNE